MVIRNQNKSIQNRKTVSRLSGRQRLSACGGGERHCAAGGVSAVVLEATTAEEDPEKGPSNDSLESSDSS